MPKLSKSGAITSQSISQSANQPASRPDSQPVSTENQLRTARGFSLFRRLEWVLDPVSYLERTKVDTPDFFEEDTLGFGAGPTVITSHPEAMQYILTRDRTTFSAPGDFNRILSPFLGTQSVIMLSGEQHKVRRQLMTPAFHGERLTVYGQLICDLTKELLEAQPKYQPLSIRTLTQKISLQVISQIVFGFTDGPRSKEIMETLCETVDSVGSPASAALLFFTWLQKDLGPWSPWGKFLRKRQRIDNLVYAEIRDRAAEIKKDGGSANSKRSDILSMLMASRTEDGEALSEQELRDELMALLFAGHETTATAMAWAMYWIHQLPAVKEKLLAELAGLGPKADPMAIAQLPYLSAVCKETLRRSPVAMFTFPRTAEAPVNIVGYSFPKGTTFLGCIFLTHQREDLYPDPKAFRPERFLERKFSPYEFIPFGAGSRRCVGEALAQYEMKLAVATMVANYQFELADERPEKPVRRGVTLAPERGVRMVVTGTRQ
ncbi:Cytochrome P450 superfamily [Synechococcus sp. PCC 7335]|uniref:cytochrome P450 n=1 Tax=Synechococcus sp. (strain ATCC 29403 / PCC 7335) TaxID=91464 RepID=UPI00017EB141|nr:cytochrome P450 [Synechococcus sp. PCC 7335]EDX86892.1 Cytochrome P450 superfamily [Synechococcus sp. PCC 7335]